MRLLLVLRDQLDRDAALLEDVDPDADVVCMTEAPSGLRRYDEHQQRLALTWSAQRHFRDDLAARGLTVHYDAIDAVLDDGAAPDVPTFLRQQIAAHAPERVAVTEPGRYELLRALEAVADEAGVPLDVYADAHFLATHETFEDWAEGRKSLTLEYFYREQRRAYDCLLTGDGKPVGGDWNFDKENRESFGRDGPQDVPDGPAFAPDDVTQAVLDLVAERFADHPGALDGFRWPVTPDQAEAALDDFLAHRLPSFGTYQDAMWTGAPSSTTRASRPPSTSSCSIRASSSSAPSGLPRRRGAPQRRRGLHSADSRLARVCPRHLLALRGRVPPERTLDARPTSRIFTGRRTRR